MVMMVMMVMMLKQFCDLLLKKRFTFVQSVLSFKLRPIIILYKRVVSEFHGDTEDILDCRDRDDGQHCEEGW